MDAGAWLLDVILVGGLVGFFGLCWSYVRFCDTVGSRRDEEYR